MPPAADCGVSRRLPPEMSCRGPGLAPRGVRADGALAGGAQGPATIGAAFERWCGRAVRNNCDVAFLSAAVPMEQARIIGNKIGMCALGEGTSWIRDVVETIVQPAKTV